MSISFVDKKTFDKCWEKFIKGSWNTTDEWDDYNTEVLRGEEKTWHEYIEPNEHIKYSDEMISARLKRGLNGETDNVIWGDAIVQVYKNWTGPMTPLEDIKFNGNSFN